MYNFPKRTLVVNLFAGAGAGKSTMSTNIFSELKWNGINAEYVPEWIKNMVWEDRKKVFLDQAYIFGKQHYNIKRLLGEVDVIVTDSPIILSAFYNKNLGELFNTFVFQEFQTFNNANYFIKRMKPYNPKGRFQTENEAKQDDIKLKNLLNENNIRYIEVNGNKDGVNFIVNDILEML